MARFVIIVWAEHLPGRENWAADAFSHDRLALFCSQETSAAMQATPLPAELLDMLVHTRPSQLWSSQFRSILQKV